MATFRKLVALLFHSVAVLVIAVVKFLAKKDGSGFGWVCIGGILIGLGGIPFAFLNMRLRFLFFSQPFVMLIVAPLLLLMPWLLPGVSRDTFHIRKNRSN